MESYINYLDIQKYSPYVKRIRRMAYDNIPRFYLLPASEIKCADDYRYSFNLPAR